ncbi:MAG: hypothetical protein AAGH89_11615 [Verrucomicrobiota bacterium]
MLSRIDWAWDWGAFYYDDSFTNTQVNSSILPSYIRVDGALFYQLSDKYRLQVNIENLLDEEYYPNSHSLNQITVGAPINASFSIRGRF